MKATNERKGAFEQQGTSARRTNGNETRKPLSQAFENFSSKFTGKARERACNVASFKLGGCTQNPRCLKVSVISKDS